MSPLTLLFPPRCYGCGVPGVALCGACRAAAAVVTPPLCARCGRPWEGPVAACADCPPTPVTASRAPFLYLGPIAAAIRGLKFSGWKALARHLAGAMVEVSDLDAEVVTWVPLSRRRRARRGFDQAELLARAVAPRLALPARRLLFRTWDTPPQARSAGARRRRAVRGAFRPSGRAPASVLLVDDVLTTGATAASCASALREAGAETVVVLVAARSVRGSIPARCFGTREGALPV